MIGSHFVKLIDPSCLVGLPVPSRENIQAAVPKAPFFIFVDPNHILVPKHTKKQKLVNVQPF